MPPSNTPVNGESNWQLGWTVGGGMEFALTDRWSAKAEYMYYDLGQESYRIDNNLIADADTQGSTVRIGVNYHFGPRCCEAPAQVAQGASIGIDHKASDILSGAFSYSAPGAVTEIGVA